MFKSLLKTKYFQPFLSIVLIGLLALLIFEFFGDKNQNSADTALKEIVKKVTFEEAYDKYKSGSYQIYTRGNLFIKNPTPTQVVDQTQASPTPTLATEISENDYSGLFFIVQNSEVKKIDTNVYGRNDSRFFDENRNFVIVDNTNKSYRVVNRTEGSTDGEKVIIESADKLFNEFFPLVPLLKEYSEGKFTPEERAFNLYSGKWQHALFTSGEVADVIIETDPTTGLFRSFSVAHGFGNSVTRIFFDFKDIQITQDLYKIPEGYAKLEESEN